MDSPMKCTLNDSTHILLITDEVDKLAKIKAPLKDLFILVITPLSSYDDQKLGQCFTELIQQSFAVHNYTLLKKVSL